MKLKVGDRIEVRIGLYMPMAARHNEWTKGTVTAVGRGDFKVECDPPFSVNLTLIFESDAAGGPFTQVYRPLGVLDRFAEET